MFSKIGATVLFVQDLDKCAAFYRDILGFRVTFTDDVSVAYKVDDHDFVVLKYSAAVNMVGESAILPDQVKGQQMLLCADVESVDDTYQALMAKGIQFIHAPADQPWGIRAAYFTDPEGHLWEIRQQLPR
jgi:catechol 2,3-dioxygenase-like lactoylglutathione lyase family enzyme